MDLGIAGRRAAVAGASSGLGLATARALAAEGVRVVIGSRSAERLEAAAASIEGDVTAVVGDVGTPDGIAGKKTADAIRAFEGATGMNETGQINPRLLAVLGSQPV